jgi:hypothetical protein
MSGLDQKIEVTSRLDQKNEGSSRHSRFDKFIESRSNLRTPFIKVVESCRGLADRLSLINVAYIVQSPASIRSSQVIKKEIHLVVNVIIY